MIDTPEMFVKLKRAIKWTISHSRGIYSEIIVIKYMKLERNVGIISCSPFILEVRQWRPIEAIRFF